jgi:hypothetical protein
MVSAAKYLLNEKRFLLIAASGLFLVSTVFTAPSFSMIAFTGRAGEGFVQQVVDSDPYYFLRQASASESAEVSAGDEPNEVVVEPVPPEPTPPPSPPECPPGTHLGTGTATAGQCIPDETITTTTPPPTDTTGEGVPESPTVGVTPPPSSEDVGTDQPPSDQLQPPSSPSSPPVASGEPFAGETDGSEFFDIVVFGDSIMWGQGLREQDKFSSLVRNELAATIKEKTNKDIPVRILDVRAHSGAKIGFTLVDRGQAGLHGEIPRSHPTIIKQVENYKNFDASSPWKIDLVLVDGCINDVNYKTILNKNVKQSELRNIIWTYCHGDMLELLNTVTTKFAYNPEIKIIVTGYYKVFSQDTEMSRMPGTIKKAFVIQDSDKTWLDQRWQVWRDESTRALELAVTEANLKFNPSNYPGRNQIFFAVPDFRDENAIFASNSFLWGVIEGETAYGINRPYPVDDVKDERSIACDRYYDDEFLEFSERWGCEVASTAHPNRGGALAYANAIKLLLPDIGLPAWVTQGVGPPAPAPLPPTPNPPNPLPPPPPPPSAGGGEDEQGQPPTTEEQEQQRCVLTTAGLLCPTTTTIANTTAMPATTEAVPEGGGEDEEEEQLLTTTEEQQPLTDSV